MSKFKDSLKEELKEEVGDLIYEKAKKEVRSKINERYESGVDKLLGFFGIHRKRKKAIEQISAEIEDKRDISMSETGWGILQLFSMEYLRAGVEITLSIVSKNEHEEESHAILTSIQNVFQKESDKSPNNPS